MTFVSVKELHDKTSEILRAAADTKAVFVTRRGKPIAVIRGLSTEELEDLVMVHHPALMQELAESFADLAAGRVVPLDEAIAMTEGELARTAHR